MLTPIEQQPNLVLDPVRQQMTPPAPVVVAPMNLASDTPVQNAGNSSQDYQSGKGQGGDVAYEQKEQARIAAQLRAAWAYLQQLKAQMAQALSGGNVMYTKRIALDAADAAASIESIAMQMPFQQSGTGTIQSTAPSSVVWLPPSVVVFDSDNDVDSASATTDTDSQALIDLARQGLGTAKDVVDQAATVPHYSVEDRTVIHLSMRKVIDAMAGVEAVAAKLSSTSSTTHSTVRHLDVKA